ncbi:hypothetical protein PLICRDRAFT_31251 [Plicaturopsis crispa FD-325 SS-3]|nr:hypothetical protein PLICRDRAFT_31251 [Plicaturopsis crispa FD-325 SS-3]
MAQIEPPKSWTEDIQPLLDTVFRDENTNLKEIPYPRIIQAYNAVYNACTSTRTPTPGTMRPKTWEAFIYQRLDDYLASACRDAAASSAEGVEQVQHYLAAYNRYVIALAFIERSVFSYVQRHWVKVEVEAGRGWVAYDGIPTVGDEFEIIEQKIERRLEALRRDWGLRDGYTAKEVAEAERLAQLNAPLERVVPIRETGLRRWRIEVVDVLFRRMDGDGASSFPDIVEARVAEGESGRQALRDLLQSFRAAGLLHDDLRIIKLEEVVGVHE